MTEPQGKCLIITLIYMLNIGRYFTYFFLQMFEEEIQQNMNIIPKEILELIEWAQWPNMILCVIIGFTLDVVLSLKTTLLFASIIIMFGKILFSLSIYFQSYLLCCMSQAICGVFYETIFIIQITFLCRIFQRNRHYVAIGILMFVCQGTMLIGYYVMPLIHRYTNCLLQTTAWLFLPHIISFLSTIWLAVFTEVSDENTRDDVVIGPNYTLKFATILIIVLFHLCPNLQFWWGFTHLISWKYEIQENKSIPILLFFLFSSLSYLVFGHLLRSLKRKSNFLILSGSLLLMFILHLALTFTLAQPYVFIVLIGSANAVIGLILRTSLLSYVPKSEFATATGFIQAIENMVFATSNDMRPVIVDKIGFMFLGCLNTFFVIIATLFSAILLYLD